MHSSISDREQDRSQPNNARPRPFFKSDRAGGGAKYILVRLPPVAHAGKSAFKSDRRLPFIHHEGTFFDIRSRSDAQSREAAGASIGSGPVDCPLVLDPLCFSWRLRIAFRVVWIEAGEIQCLSHSARLPSSQSASCRLVRPWFASE
jgi:hypothetical protein